MENMNNNTFEINREPETTQEKVGKDKENNGRTLNNKSSVIKTLKMWPSQTCSVVRIERQKMFKASEIV